MGQSQTFDRITSSALTVWLFVLSAKKSPLAVRRLLCFDFIPRIIYFSILLISEGDYSLFQFITDYYYSKVIDYSIIYDY